MVLTLLWVAMAIGAVVYALMKKIPVGITAPIAVAGLLELPFYLLPGFQGMREKLRSTGAVPMATALAVSCVVPWLAYSLPTGLFRWESFAILTLVACGVSFWYVVIPKGAWRDVIFVAGLAAIVAGRLFDGVYLTPLPKVSLTVLGHVMLIRNGALAILELRGEPGAEYRFWPDRTEWVTGLTWFAILLPVTGLVYWLLGLVELRDHPLNPLQSGGTFFGILWVTAISEEFFFRGLLLQWLEKWTSSAAFAMLVTAVLFGLVHLDMHHQFPNWRFAIVAAVAGFFYAMAYRKKRSVQASMVAHALTVTVWKTFLR